MISLTQKERDILLRLFKDFSSFYNANNITKVVQISHVGAQKILKKLRRANILISKTIGKGIFYKVNLENDYVRQLITFLLAHEANNHIRWKEEFKELFVQGRIILIYGSAIRNYSQAKDIDLMLVLKETERVDAFLKKKQTILPKKLHTIKLRKKDLLNNVKNRNESMIEIVKNAVVLFGQEQYVQIIKNVTSF
ncbi:hypothetical protein ISS07_06990 [Candidatus Woesearchaeota archaeon]|nr:hypothetical protein [Candidatus Woesearchaeota archaeon]